MSHSQQLKGSTQQTTTTDPTKKAAECCAGYKGGGVHDPSCVGTAMSAKKAGECCAGAGSGVHDPSCVGMGVTGGGGVGMGVSGGTEKRALSIKDQKSIFKFIIDDHARVNSLYNQFNQTSNQEERNKIAGLIIKEITTHSFLEETVLYPMLDKKLNTEGLNMHEHSVQEHQKVKNLLYKLDQNFQTTNESFIATLNEVMQHLRKHIDEEENQVLPKLQSKLSVQEEIELGSSWENRLTSGAHPTRPHPSAPTSEPLASMAAMAAKPLDIARDAARFGSEAMKSMKEAMGGSAEQQKTTTTKKINDLND